MSNSNKTILIVEDEENLGCTLQEYLENKGYKSLLAQNCAQGEEFFKKESPQIVLMDIGLPDGSGLDLARKMREERHDFLLLFLSALNDPDTKVQGLEIGAEDYITKPFALKELNLRLEKVFQLRQDLNQEPEVLEFGRLKIWFSRFQLKDGENQIWELGQKECAILRLLYEKRGEVVSRENIIEDVWGEDKFPSNRTVDNYIVKLRRWCETDENRPLEIQSVRGIGYKLIINSHK